MLVSVQQHSKSVLHEPLLQAFRIKREAIYIVRTQRLKPGNRQYMVVNNTDPRRIGIESWFFAHAFPKSLQLLITDKSKPRTFQTFQS